MYVHDVKSNLITSNKKHLKGQNELFNLLNKMSAQIEFRNYILQQNMSDYSGCMLEHYTMSE